MEFLQNLYVTNALHALSSTLLIPTAIILVVLIVFSVYCIGSAIVEGLSERGRNGKRNVHIPALVADLDAAGPEDIPRVIDESPLLRYQKDDLEELASYLYLPKDARTEVAKRLLANQESRLSRIVNRTDVAAKVAPILGLMGTLIPLGPGIVALGSGDTSTLSQSLLVAFDTTVAGLATAVVCFCISRIRRRWYEDDLVNMEACFNTLLEKADLLQGEGYEFPRGRYRYDEDGRKATWVKADDREVPAHSDPASDKEGKNGN